MYLYITISILVFKIKKNFFKKKSLKLLFLKTSRIFHLYNYILIIYMYNNINNI